MVLEQVLAAGLVILGSLKHWLEMLDRGEELARNAEEEEESRE